jgi:hypothetical protein
LRTAALPVPHVSRTVELLVSRSRPAFLRLKHPLIASVLCGPASGFAFPSRLPRAYRLLVSYRRCEALALLDFGRPQVSSAARCSRSAPSRSRLGTPKRLLSQSSAWSFWLPLLVRPPRCQRGCFNEVPVANPRGKPERGRHNAPALEPGLSTLPLVRALRIFRGRRKGRMEKRFHRHF